MVQPANKDCSGGFSCIGQAIAERWEGPIQPYIVRVELATISGGPISPWTLHVSLRRGSRARNCGHLGFIEGIWSVLGSRCRVSFPFNCELGGPAPNQTTLKIVNPKPYKGPSN